MTNFINRDFFIFFFGTQKNKVAASRFSPNQLQINMSRIMLSHQHSLKFGNMWRKVSWNHKYGKYRTDLNRKMKRRRINIQKKLRKSLTSINSNPMDKTHKRGWLRIMMAFPHHPMIWAKTNSSNSVSYKANTQSGRLHFPTACSRKQYKILKKKKQIRKVKRLWKKISYIKILKPVCGIFRYVDSAIGTIGSFR